MATRQKTSIAQMKVGILVTVSLLILAAAILQQSWGINWFARSAKAITYLPDVGGLKAGAPVWLAGLEIGKVTGVTIVTPEVYAGNRATLQQISQLHKRLESLDPKQPKYEVLSSDLEDQLRNLKLKLRFVEVQLQIRSQYVDRISRDSEVSIESKGLIGDSFIDISPGTYGVLPQKIGDAYLIEGVRVAGLREIMTGANDVVANLGVLSDQFKEIALKVDPDKVGTGLTDTIKQIQSTLAEAKGTMAHATLLLDEIRAGDGTIGKLVSDPAAYNRVVDSFDKFNRIAEQIEKGEGTLPKLIQDPSLYNHANEMLAKAQNVMDRVDKGEGTLGRLTKDPALYERSTEVVEKFARFIEQIEKGEGTLGKLVKDPSLYDNLNQSTAEITKLIYDLRQDPKKYLTIRFRLF